jgi:hypothetical protein
VTSFAAPPRETSDPATLRPGSEALLEARRAPGPRWTERRRIAVLGGLTVIFAFMALGLLLRKARPNVVLEARSYAVVFLPSRTVDLVGAVTPRHGLEPGGIPFTGIRFTPPLPNDASMAAFAGRALSAPPTHVRALQRLEVTAACAVRIEHYVGSLIRLDIERPAGSPTPCTMSADVTLGDSTGVLPVEVRRPVEVGAPATLLFEPPYPLHFRNLPVSEVRFETSDTGLVRSAILAARLELPDVGGAATIAHVGDAVTLGELDGNIAEMVVRDTIRTLFKGRASRPAIARRDVRPPLLQHLAHSHWRLGIGFVVTALAMAGAFVPKPQK